LLDNISFHLPFYSLHLLAHSLIGGENAQEEKAENEHINEWINSKRRK
jgi:hypothetical protein